ncbi:MULTISPECIES: ketopantoate reductase family protein [Paenibacillus]|uniref:2-dehydropantoate 2-reductase n=1 Tax=Paenibacillus lactis 154 TaxID=743719 RepID=G4HE66_9BACL|nr:2-dehydropantoate 2-reductase [Paenibacillus lactis]EHB65135.1 2-dehydropantoate 2-reductase [Paenibacillus lactis 154]MCM3495576.1 2-dehydropantoate 2-reductase [Paenibacillus lactis]GIO90516.1 2-dehydropantoate 2-reductase [Paenibacillus lactis]
MNIHILGAGSLGLLYAAKLAAAGNDITLWCRGAQQAERIGTEGISLDNTAGERTLVQPDRIKAYPLSAFSARGGAEGADVLFLMLKQQGIEDMAKQVLLPFGHAKRRLICFQNGTGHMELLNRYLPAWELYAAITTEGAKRTGPASVLHAGHGTTTIGRLPQAEGSSGQEQEDEAEIELVKQLNRAGFESFLSKEMEEMIYRKLLMNAVINPLTALWRVRNGELLASPQRVAIMRALYDEGMAVYKAGNIPCGSHLWEQIEQVCRSTSDNTSSMLKDVLEGRTTEAAWINGSIVRMGRRYRVATPHHELILQLIEGMTI